MINIERTVGQQFHGIISFTTDSAKTQYLKIGACIGFHNFLYSEYEIS